jgi:hypothetical protein
VERQEPESRPDLDLLAHPRVPEQVGEQRLGDQLAIN